EIAVQADHHDDEALQPHAHQNNERNQEQPDRAAAQLGNPEHLGNHDVADQQHVIEKRIRTVQSLPEQEGVVAVAAIPSHESFHDVAIRHDQACGQHHLGRVLQVKFGDEILEVVNLANGV